MTKDVCMDTIMAILSERRGGVITNNEWFNKAKSLQSAMKYVSKRGTFWKHFTHGTIGRKKTYSTIFL